MTTLDHPHQFLQNGHIPEECLICPFGEDAVIHHGGEQAPPTAGACESRNDAYEDIVERAVGCEDCGLPYGSVAWADFVVADDVWAKIGAEIPGKCPEAMILCAHCMVARANYLGLEAEGRFTSGPFAVDGWLKPAKTLHPDDCPACLGTKTGQQCAEFVESLPEDSEDGEVIR